FSFRRGKKRSANGDATAPTQGCPGRTVAGSSDGIPGVTHERTVRQEARGAPSLSRQILYHFCRLQLPGITLTPDRFDFHLERTYALHQGKVGATPTWEGYLEALYPLDWFVACACLEGDTPAWEHLFAARAGRSDCLLVDALRARAIRLYPRDHERQESAVAE